LKKIQKNEKEEEEVNFGKKRKINLKK